MTASLNNVFSGPPEKNYLILSHSLSSIQLHVRVTFALKPPCHPCLQALATRTRTRLRPYASISPPVIENLI